MATALIPTAPRASENRGGLQAARPVLFVTSVAAFMAFLDATIVNIVFPSVQSSFPGEPLSTLSWVLNGYNVILAAFLAPAGTMADRFGRRRLFATGVLLFTLFSAGCTLAPTAGWLVAMRIGQAFGAALLVPASMALLLQSVPVHSRATAVAIYAATASVAAGIGPTLGGILIELADWRLVFLVNLPIGILTLVATYRYIEESRSATRAKPDLLGGALLAVGIGSLALGLVKGPEWGWTSVSVLSCFVVAVAAVGFVVVHSRRCEAPILNPHLLRRRSLASANLATLLFAAGFFCANLCGVLFLTTVWDYSVIQAGLAVSPSPLISAVVAVPAGRVADRYGHRVVAVPGAILFGLGISFLALRTGTEPDYLRTYFPATLVFGTGVGLAFPALTSRAVTAVPDEHFAAASATNAVVRQVGAVLGVSILVATIGTSVPLDLGSTFHRAWLIAALLGVVSVLAAMGMRREAIAAAPP